MFFEGDAPPRGRTWLTFWGTQWGNPIHIVIRFHQNRLRNEGTKPRTNGQTHRHTHRQANRHGGSPRRCGGVNVISRFQDCKSVWRDTNKTCEPPENRILHSAQWYQYQCSMLNSLGRPVGWKNLCRWKSRKITSFYVVTIATVEHVSFFVIMLIHWDVPYIIHAQQNHIPISVLAGDLKTLIFAEKLSFTALFSNFPNTNLTAPAKGRNIIWRHGAGLTNEKRIRHLASKVTSKWPWT